LAQTSDYERNEFYVGYSHQQLDSGSYRPANGFEAAYVRNVHRYFGIKADVSGAYRRETFEITALNQPNGTYTYRGRASRHAYNFLGGVQVKNNASEARFKPFAHALAGVAVTRFKNSSLTCTAGACPSFINNAPAFSSTRASFAMAVGGGLDIKINDKIDFRAIQVDYNPIFRSGVEHNVRFGIGFVFK
jgi:opacity protein-like surface antigen